MIDSMMPEENPPQEVDQLERIFIFCLVWSLGAALTLEDRVKFDQFVKKNAGILLPSSSLYENLIDITNMSWVPWERKVELYEPPEDKKFSKILVPTVDTMRYSWLLEQIMSLKKPALFVGDSGTAKSVTIYS
jgi:dynein heavy chain